MQNVKNPSKKTRKPRLLPSEKERQNYQRSRKGSYGLEFAPEIKSNRDLIDSIIKSNMLQTSDSALQSKASDIGKQVTI